MDITQKLLDLNNVTGYAHLIKDPIVGLNGAEQFLHVYGTIIMFAVCLLLLFLAIRKGYEPLLLIPIGFGGILANIPLAGIADDGGFLNLVYKVGIESGVFPLLIFMGVGALTDFGPLIANKKTMLLGAAAQIGIFITFLGALALGFSGREAAAIGIIGGADGPTAILVTKKLAEGLLAPISIAAYSYMALVPVIQPPIMKLLTTKKERAIKMEQLRPVSKREKILFPIIVATVTILIVPSCAPLIGCLMLGNLIKESGVVPKITDALANSLMYIVTILIGLCVGATASGDTFLSVNTLKIFALGIIAFSIATAFGVLAGKVMCVATKGKVNPLIGAAGVSAVPMAARVVNKVGRDEDPSNFLLMHAMGPNVAGVIGSAVAAGIFLMLAGII